MISENGNYGKCAIWIFIAFLFFPKIFYAQELSEIIELHKTNLKRLYQHHDDSLNVIMLTKAGIVFARSTQVSKETLMDRVRLANLKFSRHSGNSAPKKRGAYPVSDQISKDRYSKVFSWVNHLILPDEEYLKDLNHLIIVPTLNIATIPFSALQITESEYLIDWMSYPIAPTMSSPVFGVSMIRKRELS